MWSWIWSYRIDSHAMNLTARRLLLSVSLFATSVPALLAQTQAELKQRMDLVLEKKEGASVRVVEPNYVFLTGDKLRFRLRSDVNGFLYVLDRGSSGQWRQLFPRDELTQSRRVSAGHDYLIPASGSGWFEVSGPSGYDSVYFLISPIDLGKTLPEGSQSASDSETNDAAALAAATPRCDDELFRSRGECLDSNAGLKPLAKGEALPGKFSDLPVENSRDLIVVDGAKGSTVSSTEPFEAPTIYRFRIAHKIAQK